MNLLYKLGKDDLNSVSTTELLQQQQQQKALKPVTSKFKISILSRYPPIHNRHISNNLIWQVNFIMNEKVRFKSKSTWKNYLEIIITKVSYFVLDYLWPCKVFLKFSFENLTAKIILTVFEMKIRRWLAVTLQHASINPETSWTFANLHVATDGQSFTMI